MGQQVIRSLILFAALLFAGVASAAHPYDSACRVSIEHGARQVGGSGVLIAVEGERGLVLTVKHVALRAGNPAKCNWAGQVCLGQVLAVHPNADVALLVVTKPKNVRPVPIARPSKETGPFVLVGFPGYDRKTMRYQVGDFAGLSEKTLTVTCRPEKGMSGGPTFDRYGRVVGTVSAYSKFKQYGYVGSGDALVELVGQ